MSRVHIRNNIRRLRFNASEMTQQQLAERVGVTRQTTIAIEGDKYSPYSRWRFASLASSVCRWKTCFSTRRPTSQ